MASPFRVFRKHQKKLLATLGIMAIVAFCIPIGFLDYIRSPSRAAPVVVESSKYGDIKESELHRLRLQRQQVLSFLQRVEQAVVVAKREANLQAKAEDQVVLAAQAADQAERMIGPASEEAVVDTWLYARHAEQLGLVVTNETINEFIREVTEGYLGPGQVKKILRDLNTSQRRFFEMLRYELLALRVRLMFNVSLAGTTPAQRWHYYTRLKRLATIEVIPVPVANYVDKVKEPPTEVLQEFFQEHKDNYPDPTSPQPGFRKPHQIAVRYFKADLEKFMAPSVVTDDEVRKFYQENKELFDRIAPPIPQKPVAEKGKGGEAEKEKPLEGPKAEKSGETEAKQPPQEPVSEKPGEAARKSAEEPTAEKKAEEKGGGDVGKESAGSPSETKEGESGEDKAEEPATESKNRSGKEEEPSEEKPAEGAQKADGPAVEPNSSEMSSGGEASPFRLASLLEEKAGEAEPAAAEPPAKQPAESPPHAGRAADEAAGPALGPEPPADQKKPAGEAEPAEQTQGAGETAGPAEVPAEGPTKAPADLGQKGPAGEEEKPEGPLAGPVGEMIRRQLAGQKIQEIFGRLQGEMNQYRNELVRYEVDVETDPSTEKPRELDFEALARENDPTGDQGLTTGQTSLISQWDILDETSGIGRSFVDLGSARVPFTDYAYREKWDLYLAAQSSEIGDDYRERSRYLLWKVKDSKEKIPTFEDPGVRQQVLQAWKTVEARKLAIKAAEKLGDEARKAGLSLAATFIERPDLAVTATRPFSWMTYGNVPLGTARTPPRLSNVTGVEMPGPDFMRTVFGLKKGEIGVAMNHPKTIAYTIRVTEINPSEKVLWAQFEVDDYGTYAEVAGADRARMIQAWQDELKNAAGLKWVRPPRVGQND
jgi:hypothetical protein